eukprot:36840-Eustigmatos_ZCMA.PRE.1
MDFTAKLRANSGPRQKTDSGEYGTTLRRQRRSAIRVLAARFRESRGVSPFCRQGICARVRAAI